MLKKLFSIKYTNPLILEMLKSTKTAMIATNFIGSLLIIIALYSHIPNLYLVVWLSLNMIIAILRIQIASKLSLSIKNDTNHKDKYLKQYLIVVTLNGLLFGIIALVGMFYHVPHMNFFIIATVIIALTAGSITTLGTVFIGFVAYVLSNLIPLIIAFIYHGGMLFYEFAIILIIFCTIHIKSGYRLFLTYKLNGELESKFKTIYDKSSDGIAIIKNNQIIECNNALVEMFGFPKDKNDFFKTNIFNLSPLKQEDKQSSAKKMLKMLKKAKETSIVFDWTHIKKDTKPFWVEIRLNTIEINNEKIIHGVWRNIDYRKKAEKEIQDLNDTLVSRVDDEVNKNREKDKKLIEQSRLAQMGEMISMIAHQWRQPLTAINSTSIFLELKANLGELKNDMVIKQSQNISKYTQHLSETIDDFRNFYKPNKEIVTIKLEDVFLKSLQIINASLISDKIDVVHEFNSDVEVNIYANEMMQVILNILKNAQDNFLEKEIKNPQIVIKTKDTSISISDNGGGIKNEIIDKIFDPYFSTKDEKNGTGLGLYMSKTIVEEHHKGTLHVENKNNGTSFTIEINQ